MCNLVSPCSHEAKEAKNWSVEQVCRFVSTVEHCQPFVEVCIKVYSHQKYLSIKPKCSKTFTAILIIFWPVHSIVQAIVWFSDWFRACTWSENSTTLPLSYPIIWLFNSTKLGNKRVVKKSKVGVSQLVKLKLQQDDEKNCDAITPRRIFQNARMQIEHEY